MLPCRSLGDVLCTYDRPARIAYLAGLAGITPAAVDALIWGSGFEDAADIGEVSGDDTPALAEALQSYGLL